MSGRSEWPTAARRSELRARGIVPYSRLSTRAVGSAAFLVALGVGVRTLEGSGLGKVAGCIERGSVGEMISVVGTLAGELLVVPVICGTLAVVAWGLFQTRVLVYPAALAPEFSKLKAARRFNVGEVIQGVGTLAVFPGVFIGSVLFLAPVAIEALGLPDNNARFAHLLSVYRLLGGSMVLVLVALAAFGWLASRVAFALRYRMTKQEIQQESRE